MKRIERINPITKPQGRLKRFALTSFHDIWDYFLLQIAKLLGYSNDVNPFGDSNLLQPFVWGKKSAKDEKKAEIENPEDKRLKLMDEINKVRKRREDREKEMEEMEKLRSEEQRLREAVQFGDWQQKEEEFHLNQSKARSKIRLVEKREQPIDTLAKNILMIEAMTNEKDPFDLSRDKFSDLEVELRDPVSLVEGLELDQLGQLHTDIESYRQLSLRSSDGYESFWDSMKMIVSSLVRTSQSAIHRSLHSEIDALLISKSSESLERLEKDIKRGIGEGLYSDVPYWEAVVEEIVVRRAKAFVKATHKCLLLKQLELLSMVRQHNDIKQLPTVEGEEATGASDGVESTIESRFIAEAGDVLEGVEELMRDEVTLPGEVYLWQDKYRPRKPRYLNKVRTGWDWNKYNQTHYDFDNPPPKTIHGYRFAIFYPDLIDKSIAPKYHLEPSDDPDFAIIRFHAGPPYEDIAFKILNRQWDINRRSGFRCVFERGILQLNFNFKRRLYRR